MYLWGTQIVDFLYHLKEMIQYVTLTDTWNIIKFLPSIRENWIRLPICTICKLHLIFSTLVSGFNQSFGYLEVNKVINFLTSTIL